MSPELYWTRAAEYASMANEKGSPEVSNDLWADCVVCVLQALFNTPVVGDPVTYSVGSDRYPGYVLRVLKNAVVVYAQGDAYRFYRRANGRYYAGTGSCIVSFTKAEEVLDPHK